MDGLPIDQIRGAFDHISNAGKAVEAELDPTLSRQGFET